MKTYGLITILCVAAVAEMEIRADAAEQHRVPRAAAAPRGNEAGTRYRGVHVVPHANQPIHQTQNPPHQVIFHNARTGREERHAVIVEHRPPHIIDRDPRIRISRRGYRSPRHWEHFHPVAGGWLRLWGISAWDAVGTVTCEAANETTGELFPVSMDRDQIGWGDEAVDSVLDQALDDCAAEAGEAVCVPVTPACTFQNY